MTLFSAHFHFLFFWNNFSDSITAYFFLPNICSTENVQCNRNSIICFHSSLLFSRHYANRSCDRNCPNTNTVHQITFQLRIASIIAASVLVSFALIIRKRTMDPSNVSFRIMNQCITCYMALNTLGNFMSFNSFEKYMEGTLTVILTISTGIVGFGSDGLRDSYIDID